MINYKKILLIMPLLLALGIVMVLIMKMMVSMETGTIIIALLVPWLGYLLLSGAIQELGLLTVARFIYLLYTILIFFDPLTCIQLFESNRSEKEKWMLSSPRLDQCLSVIERRE